MIGITGSVGKSSTREILYGILKEHFPTKVIAGNTETGLPLGILGLKAESLGFETMLVSLIDWLRIFILAPILTNSLKGFKYLIIEMSIDDPYPPKNMEYLLTIVKPDIAVVLNVAPVHTMQFEKIIGNGKKEFANEEEKVDFLVQKIAEEKVKIITQSGCKNAIYNADNKYVTNAIQLYYSANVGASVTESGNPDSSRIL